jgi:hypothetical protein
MSRVSEDMKGGPLMVNSPSWPERFCPGDLVKTPSHRPPRLATGRGSQRHSGIFPLTNVWPLSISNYNDQLIAWIFAFGKVQESSSLCKTGKEKEMYRGKG